MHGITALRELLENGKIIAVPQLTEENIPFRPQILKIAIGEPDLFVELLEFRLEPHSASCSAVPARVLIPAGAAAT